MNFTLRINGDKRKVDVPPARRLLDTLREDLGLTGTKEGCGEGECGACSVLIDGAAVNSCLVPTCQAEGTEVTTVEGLAGKRKLSRLQRAFLGYGAAQCGICTPGMLIAAAALPEGSTVDAIREGLAGNLCRCTGYVKIIEAVHAALNRGPLEPEAPAPDKTTGKAAPIARGQAARAQATKARAAASAPPMSKSRSKSKSKSKSKPDSKVPSKPKARSNRKPGARS